MKRLAEISLLLTTDPASGLTTISGPTTSGDRTNFADFTTNVIELTEKLGIPIEQVQPPSSSNS
ncbi:hypothetical protein U2F10_23905 [Leptothoe sp. EHU-05/26/07-4]